MQGLHTVPEAKSAVEQCHARLCHNACWIYKLERGFKGLKPSFIPLLACTNAIRQTDPLLVFVDIC